MSETPIRGHPLNPFDEPIHEGHMVKLLAPSIPVAVAIHGHSYVSRVEPDPTSPIPGATRHYVMAWGCHVAELLAQDPPYRYPDPNETSATIPPVEAPTPEPAPVGKAK